MANVAGSAYSALMSTSSPLPRLLDLDRPALAAWCQQLGHAPFRADQIRRWMFGKRVDTFEAMHDLPATLRADLAAHFFLFEAEVTRHQIASDRTEKLLLQLGDAEFVECVLMRETGRQTVCISTQVGCAMGCIFCASGLQGVKRNLRAGEILEQVLRLDRRLSLDERITNVVVMGLGEPLMNLGNLLPALETLSDKGGLGMGARRITISTVGLPKGIRQLAESGRPYNLAVSLHAPNDELRNHIVPVNDRIGIAAILEAADEYFEKTGRRVTYEYVLLGGVNDSPDHARQLAGLLRSRTAHVNLIPMNPVDPIDLHAPSRVAVARFVEELEAGGVNVTIRKRKGADIDAACGQLRLQELTTAKA